MSATVKRAVKDEDAEMNESIKICKLTERSSQLRPCGSTTPGR